MSFSGDCFHLTIVEWPKLKQQQEPPKTLMALDPSKVSHHVHRIGYHFRSEIFDEACSALGYHIYKGKLIRDTSSSIAPGTSGAYSGRKRYGDRSGATVEETIRVKAAVRELFPKIPDSDLDLLVDRAWEKVCVVFVGIKRIY